MNVGVVKGRSDRVLLRPSSLCCLPSACVHVQINFFRWNRCWFGLKLVDLRFMLARAILITRLVEVAFMTHELKAVEVGARTWISQVSWWFVAAGARGCGTESRYFGAEGIAHHVFDCSNNFNLILSVCSWTWILVCQGGISIFHRVKRCHTARNKVEVTQLIYENIDENPRVSFNID